MNQINPFPFPATYIDNGFWRVTRQTAGRIAKPYRGLPRHGYERAIITSSGQSIWLTRTITNGEQIWSVRLTELKHKS